MTTAMTIQISRFFLSYLILPPIFVMLKSNVVDREFALFLPSLVSVVLWTFGSLPQEGVRL